MPPKPKPTTKKRANPRTKSVVSNVFDKVGLFKAFTNYGLGGCVVGYLLVFTVPEIQKSFTGSLERISAENREDRKAAFEHGEKAVERIATSIDGLRGTFSTVQGTTQTNQRMLIEESKRTNEILESIAPMVGSPPK